MNTNLNRGFAKTILIVFMVCLTILISTNPSVRAQEGVFGGASRNMPESETMLDPVPGGPGFIMVSPFSFQPYNKFSEWNYSGGGLYNPSVSMDTYLVAGLTIPHGATITQVTLYYKDDHPEDNISLFFYRGDETGMFSPVASLVPDSDSSDYQSYSVNEISNSVIDNQSYSYYLIVSFPPIDSVNGELILTNVRLDYAYTSDLPLVIK